MAALNPENLRGFDHVRVTKKDLQKALQKNCDNHVKEFNEAMEGFRAEWILKLKAEMAQAASNQPIDGELHLEKPVCHEKDYQRVLDMLEFSQDDEFIISMRDFNQYVRDEWDWTRGFKRMSETYSGSRR